DPNLPAPMRPTRTGLLAAARSVSSLCKFMGNLSGAGGARSPERFSERTGDDEAAAPASCRPPPPARVIAKRYTESRLTMQKNSPFDRSDRAGGAYRRATISFLISAIAFAGLRPLGQVLVQFMIVWHR